MKSSHSKEENEELCCVSNYKVQNETVWNSTRVSSIDPSTELTLLKHMAIEHNIKRSLIITEHLIKDSTQ